MHRKEFRLMAERLNGVIKMHIGKPTTKVDFAGDLMIAMADVCHVLNPRFNRAAFYKATLDGISLSGDGVVFKDEQ